jgi:hypothetical protein
MSDVPKIVRQRAAQQSAGEHPDANLLAAFAEGGLTQGERAQVLAHLGMCAACRNVIALALPESAVPVPAAAQPATSWLRWPMLRWAGAAAAAIVVAAAIMLVRPHQQAPAPMKQTEVAVSADKTATKPAEAPAAVPVGPAPTDQVRRKDSASAAAAAKQEPKSKAFKKEDASSARGLNDTLGEKTLNEAPAPRGLDRLAKPNQALQAQAPAEPSKRQQVPAQAARVQPQVPATIPQAPPPARTTAGTVGGVVALQKQAIAPPSQPAVTGKNVQVETQSQVAAEQHAQQQLRTGPQARDSLEVTSAAPPVAANSAARAPMTTIMLKAVPPRWRVSAEGELERSIDAGRSWQTVRVASPPVGFRSVSTVNHDVWAGGASGALYHSSDDGRTWTRVTVQAFDMVLATDIARVEFTDTLHGTVTTADGVKWVTGDAGATWSVVAKPPR